jgi:23S rRNA (cytosine1962-C5)-methyltransferase
MNPFHPALSRTLLPLFTEKFFHSRTRQTQWIALSTSAMIKQEPEKPRLEVEHRLMLAEGWTDYELLDTGDGLKRERWGDTILVRPDPQIIWPRQAESRWQEWDGYYHRSDTGGGRWEFRRPLPESWTMQYGELTLKIRPTDFKHTGLFPEQAVNWDWSAKKIRARKLQTNDVSVLNLFGYTGAATLASAAAGASVCHVDASKGVVQWCRENAALSKLNDSPIRYIADDCLKFTAREARRGRHYDGIILDPPAYGRGAAGEIWKIEEDLWPLLLECRALLSERPLFLIINSYASKLSPLLIGNLLTKLMAKHGGRVMVGELGLPSEREGIVLPCGICGRWESA